MGNYGVSATSSAEGGGGRAGGRHRVRFHRKKTLSENRWMENTTNTDAAAEHAEQPASKERKKGKAKEVILIGFNYVEQRQIGC